MDALFQIPVYLIGIMGLLFFLPPLGVIIFKLAFRIGCLKAYGQVIRIERNRDPDGAGVRIQPVIQFTSRDGEILEFKTGSGYGLRYMPALHATVKLYYRPGSIPLAAQVASRGLWEVSAILMVTGLVLMLPAILENLL